MPEKNFNLFKIKDYQVIIFTALILLVFYLLSYLVDIHNIYGARDWMVEHQDFNVPFLWNYLFAEGAPVEILQWLFIGLMTMSSAYIAGIYAGRGSGGSGSPESSESSVKKFWILFGILGVLMIMEDAGNVRHFLTVRGVLLFRDEMIYRSITELSYFGLMALLPAVALLKYRHQVFKNRRAAVILLAGCGFYALAVGMSGTRDIRFWYQTAGTFFYDWTVELGGEELALIYEEVDSFLAEGGHISIRYRFMDFLVEESLELLGAAFLWASTLAFLEGLPSDAKK